MVSVTKKKLNPLFALFIAVLPIIPEYFRAAGYPVLVFLPIIPFLALGLGKRKIKIPRSFKKILLPLLIIAIISYGIHGELSSLLRYITTVVMTILVIVNYVKDDDDIYRAFCILAYVGIAMCLLGIVEKMTGFNIFSLIETDSSQSARASIRRGVARVELSFGTPIVAGLYMIFINAIARILIADKRTSKNKKYPLYFLVIMTFVITYWTDSRMCMMTLILMQVLFFMRNRWSKKLVVGIIVLFILGMDFALQGFLYQFYGKYLTLISSIFTSGSGTTDITTAYRFQLFPTLLPRIKDSLLFGYGSSYMNNYTFSIWGHTYYSIDNMFLDVLMRHGLIGLVLVLTPIIYSIVLSYRLIKEKEALGYYLLCVFIIYLLNLVSVTQLGEQKIFYTLFGVVLTAMYLAQKEKQQIKIEDRNAAGSNS